MIPTTLTKSWQQIATDVSVLLVEAKGREALIYIGSAAPSADTDPGFTIPSGVPTSVPHITELGGKVWARGEGVILHASA